MSSRAAKRQKCRACRQQVRCIDFPKGRTTCRACLKRRGLKVCSKCQKPKAFANFAKSSAKKDGHHPVCKQCQKPAWKRYYARDPAGNAKRTRDRWAANRPQYRLNKQLRKFGISLEEFQVLVSRAGNLCMICRKPESRTRKTLLTNLCLDHCHTTGKIRGLLCSACNSGIGLLRDDPLILAAAVRYLEDFNAGLH